MHTVLLILNLFVALGSVVVATIALNAPETFSRSSRSSPGELFYTRMFAARTIPFGFAIGVLPFYPGGPGAAYIVLTAAVVQVLDAVIGMARQERPQILLASIAACVHVLCGISILTST